MISIAVCDDNAVKGQWIADKAAECLDRAGTVYEKRLFTGGGPLLHEIREGMKFDLVLLDIEMPGMNGMELTEWLKQCLPDVLIIFITSYEKYVYESFRVQPYRFIPKRCLEQMLPSALEDAVRLIGDREGRFYLAENQKGLENIPLSHIIYIWHKEKYAYIEKTDGTNTKVRKTLKQVYQELPKGDFEWVDRGIIRNIAQIARFKEGDILFTNGARVSVSKSRLTELKDRLRRYWVEKGDNK